MTPNPYFAQGCARDVLWLFGAALLICTVLVGGQPTVQKFDLIALCISMGSISDDVDFVTYSGGEIGLNDIQVDR